MPRPQWILTLAAISAWPFLAGCEADTKKMTKEAAPAAAPVKARAQFQGASEVALPAEKTGGFDGAKAFEHVRRQVEIGPRPPGSEGIRKAQDYIRETLKGFGCQAEEDDFAAQTPKGRVPMKNIVAKIPGRSDHVVLLLTHYDTKQLENFVGALDGGSSTGIMLELARHLCGQRRAATYWIAFLDGEEAYGEWSDTDSTYGSRELAARLSNSSELTRVKAVILADIVGEVTAKLDIKREGDSTKWLKDIIWGTAKRLGYGQYFLEEETPIDDDHKPFLKRGVPAVDIIDLDYQWWHTPEDSLDKVSAKSLGIVGHVILESLGEVEKKVAGGK